MKIAIYARKSKLTDTGDSIKMQFESCQHYITRTPELQSFDIEYYQDEGFSGGNTNRPDFQRMLTDCIEGKIAYVLCYKIDRFSRSLADFSGTYRILENNNINFISTTDQFDTSTPMGRAMLNIAMVFSELEKDTITQRIRDNLMHLSYSGKWLGGTPPLGYQSVSVNYTKDNHEKTYKQLEIDLETAPIVRLIFSKYLEYGSLSALESYLINHEIKSRNNKYFRLGPLREILSNPTYCGCDVKIYHYFKQLGCNITFNLEECDPNLGIMPFNRSSNRSKQTSGINSPVPKLRPYSEWIIAQGTHTPIITADEWLQTQKQIAVNATKNPYGQSGSTSQIALLTGLLYCKKCGAVMKVTNQCTLKDGTISYVYRCTNKLRSHGKLCNVNNAKGHYLDSFIMQQLAHQLKNKDEFIGQLLAQKDVYLGNTQKALNIKSNIESNIIDINKQVKNLIHQVATIDPKDFKREPYLSVLENEIEELLLRKSELSNTLNEVIIEESKTLNRADNIDLIINRISNFCCVLDNASLAEKRALLHNIIAKLEWDGETIHIYFLTDKMYNANRNLPHDGKITTSRQ